MSEPLGSVKPKFPAMDKLRAYEFSYKENATLLCPAQAYPIPSQR